MKLIGKFIISGTIRTLTGLHIGGSKNTKRIGDIDNNIIKSAKGIPYIPGSSLKGKMRSMLTKQVGSVAISADDLQRDIEGVDKKIKEEKKKDKQNSDKINTLEKYIKLLENKLKEGKTDDNENFKYLYEIFGSPGNEDSIERTRLLIRDACLDTEAFEEKFGDKKEYLDFKYSQSKFENVINRVSGTALHPRQLERVPAGAEFDFKMVYDVYNDEKAEDHLKRISNAMELLEDDYVGGSGSRGYGEIEFADVVTKYKSISDEGYQLTKANNYSDLFKQSNNEV